MQLGMLILRHSAELSQLCLPSLASGRRQLHPLPSLYAAVTVTLGDLFKYRKERLINKGVYPEALKQNCFSLPVEFKELNSHRKLRCKFLYKRKTL